MYPYCSEVLVNIEWDLMISISKKSAERCSSLFTVPLEVITYFLEGERLRSCFAK